MDPFNFTEDDVSVLGDDFEGGFELFQFESFCDQSDVAGRQVVKRQRDHDGDTEPDDLNLRFRCAEALSSNRSSLDCDIDTESVSSSDSSVSLYMNDSFSNSMIRRHIVNQVLDTLNLGDMIGLSNLIQDHFCESCSMIHPVLSEPIYGRGDVMMFLSMMIENYPDAILRFSLESSSSDADNVISMTYAVTGTMVFDQPFNMQFAKVKEHRKKVQLFKGIVGSEFLDNLACCWIPVAPSGSIGSDSSSSFVADQSKSRRRCSLPSNKSGRRQPVAKSTLKSADGLPFSSFGTPAERILQTPDSFASRNSIFKLRGRVDCVFDASNKVNRVLVASL